MKSATGETLDLDYSNQGAVPDFQNYFDAWRDDSAIARNRLNCDLDIRYGGDWRETLDIFPGRKGGPVVIFVHGGWFYFLDKSDFSYLAPAYVEKGATFVAVAYPLAPKARIAEICTSVEKAILWVGDNIGRFGGDPESLHVAGHSAGGHLATMMAFLDWRRHGLAENTLKTCCSVSGLYDLTPILSTAHNQKINLTPQDIAGNSPIDAISDHGTRIIASVGKNEVSGFLWQHETFLAECRARDREVTDASVPGKHHFNVVDELGNSNSALFELFWKAVSERPTE